MFAIIFKEQLRKGSPVTRLPEVSLNDYKIDYNHCLGEGTHGKIYSLILRPKEDHNLLSSWFPCTYDYCFRTNNSETQWCIKILDSIIDPVLIVEWQSNFLQQKYRMTSIVFPATYPFFAQIKTRIIGNTLEHYLGNHYFKDPEQFFFRKAYVNLQWTLKNVPLKFADLIPANIMYDEVNHRMEIIDAYARETRRKNDNPILFCYSSRKKTQNMLGRVFKVSTII